MLSLVLDCKTLQRVNQAPHFCGTLHFGENRKKAHNKILFSCIFKINPIKYYEVNSIFCPWMWDKNYNKIKKKQSKGREKIIQLYTNTKISCTTRAYFYIILYLVVVNIRPPTFSVTQSVKAKKSPCEWVLPLKFVKISKKKKNENIILLSNSAVTLLQTEISCWYFSNFF